MFCQLLQPLNFAHQLPDIRLRHRLIILHVIAHISPGKQIFVRVHAVIVVGRCVKRRKGNLIAQPDHQRLSRKILLDILLELCLGLSV